MQATATKTTKSGRAAALSSNETALRLGALLRHLFVFDRGGQLRAMEESGLTLTQCKALLVLSGPGPDAGGDACPGKDLAEQIGLSMATISRAVDGLVDAGYVTRVEDPDDRRVRRIAITDAGEEVVGRILTARLEGLREFSQSLTPAERRKLDSALDLLLERDELAQTYEKLKEFEG
jgi:DNA-binding MarR family transcriptional regulator